jgi:hypothetical protein
MTGIGKGRHTCIHLFSDTLANCRLGFKEELGAYFATKLGGES